MTSLIDAIIAEQLEPEPKLPALQQALDGRVSLAMQQYMVNVSDPKTINLVDLSAELGVEQVIIDRLGSIIGTTDPQVQTLNQQNAAHFGVVRGGGHDLGDAEAFEAYDDLSVELLNDIDKNLTNAASDARGLAIANAVVTGALAAGRDLPGPAGLPHAAEPDPPGARGCPRGRQHPAAGDGRQDPGRRRPGRDHPDPRAHPRGDGPAGPRGRRHAPAGRAPGVRRGQAALAGRRDVLDPVPPQHLAHQPAARPDRAAGEGRGGPEPPRVAVPTRPPRLAHAPYGRLPDGAGRRADADQRQRRARPGRRVPGRDGRCAGVPARPDRVLARRRRSTAPPPPTWCT